MSAATGGGFTNVWLIAKFMLRRERAVSTAWVALLALVVVGLVPAMYVVLDAEARAAVGPMLDMPAMVSMVGPAYLGDGFGGLYANFMLLFTAFTVGIMNIFLVSRLTRADEEKGRFEVLRSLPIGRMSNLGAACIVAAIVNAALFLVMWLGMFAVGAAAVTDGSVDFVGSLFFGASLGVLGLVTAGLTALMCELSASSRAAVGYSFATLGIFYLLRAPGDMNPDMVALSYISPLGLVLRPFAYVENNWPPLLIMLGVAAVLFAAAYKFNAIRDIEQGMIPAKPGRATGGLLLRGPVGLAIRLTKGQLIAWAAAIFLIAASYATVLGEIDEFIANNEMYQQMILGPAGIDADAIMAMPPETRVEAMRNIVSMAGYTITELFASMINSMMAMAAIVPLVIFALRAKSEETMARSEVVQATPASRSRYLAGYVGMAYAGAVILQLAFALGLYSVGQSVLDNPAELGARFVLQSTLVYIPALWVMIGAAVLIFGAAPKLTGLIWGYFAYTFIIIFMGRMDLFPAVFAWLTPIGHVPQLPMETINPLTLIALCAVAGILTAAGFVLYGRRDVNAVVA